jgi:hypothetical protein
VVLTGGERNEQIALEAVPDQGAIRRPGRGRPRLCPRTAAGDKAYSSPTARARLRRCHIRPVIPTRPNFDTYIYIFVSFQCFRYRTTILSTTFLGLMREWFRNGFGAAKVYFALSFRLYRISSQIGVIAADNKKLSFSIDCVAHSRTALALQGSLKSII